ncbi:MAG: acyltransferase family protein, partial [Isosphaeraceae bacterium]
MSTVHQSVKNRIVSLDQFRGYTVAGMLLVNFIGGFREVGAVWKHHNTYFSYADTIMPQFFFAVGFAMRLTFLRRLKSLGVWRTVRAAVQRNLGLILLGFVIYHLDKGVKSWDELVNLGVHGFFAQAFERELFQTLVHIALASLWVMPVIAAGTAARVGFLIASSALHLGLSHWFYFEHAWHLPVIDGGPLGFLTWSIPVLVGSLAYDAVAGKQEESSPALNLMGWSIVLMGLGFGLSCLAGSVPPPPFVEPAKDTVVNMWTMSQRTGSVSYQVFAAGVSLAFYALFVIFCDERSLRVGLFRTFGQNALAAYIVHPMVAGAVRPYMPDDSPLWFVLAGFLFYFGICYVLIHY